jgi:hypothetical protein
LERPLASVLVMRMCICAFLIFFLFLVFLVFLVFILVLVVVVVVVVGQDGRDVAFEWLGWLVERVVEVGRSLMMRLRLRMSRNMGDMVPGAYAWSVSLLGGMAVCAHGG